MQHYWQLLCSGAIPYERDIDIFALKDSWDSCFLVHYLGADAPLNARFSYLYLGDAIISAYGDTMSQRDICKRLIYPSNPQLVQAFMHVVTHETPHSQEADFVNDGGLIIKYRSIMLPLLGNDDKVTYILGGMRWKSCL